ncbi:hypothetical protein LTR37_019424 [Vermiconidia calcicola]|uniref:Uncharacterized protein n=1 Tax=Vermiconidia calcicola TaxID=1690605 RepID=A0ACC3ME90_9PEZI|nr:hypothetical protein LTR37_019424 [Vermiconidia calcicola]
MMKSWGREQVDQRWQATCQAETKGRVTYSDTAIPSKNVLGFHESLSKSQNSLLVQPPTGKIGLRDFLFRREVSDVPGPMKLKDLHRPEFRRDIGWTNLQAILNKRKLAIKAIKFIEQARILGQNTIVEE